MTDDIRALIKAIDNSNSINQNTMTSVQSLAGEVHGLANKIGRLTVQMENQKDINERTEKTIDGLSSRLNARISKLDTFNDDWKPVLLKAKDTQATRKSVIEKLLIAVICSAAGIAVTIYTTTQSITTG